jgi:hypothetical protein
MDQEVVRKVSVVVVVAALVLSECECVSDGMGG